MALTGNIEIFPLQEVLRLLARSTKDGCLHIETAEDHGRVYLRGGSLTLATTATDSQLVDQLVASGVIDGDRVDTANEMYLPDLLAADRSVAELTDFIREHAVESLYRMRRPGSGAFEFQVDTTPRLATGQTFDSESAIAEADRRASDWADIEQTIADMHLPVRMLRELHDAEVTIAAPTWRVLATLEGGASVSHVARSLGTTNFRTASEVASLIRAGLVEAVPVPAPASEWNVPPVVEETQPTSEEVITPQIDPWSQEPDADPVSEWQAPAWDRADSGESPEDEGGHAETEAPTEDAETPETTKDDANGSTRGGWWADAMESHVDEQDADAFLESVFSDLDASDSDEETGFAVGLLRRRRMGPITRDLSGSE